MKFITNKSPIIGQRLTWSSSRSMNCLGELTIGLNVTRTYLILISSVLNTTSIHLSNVTMLFIIILICCTNIPSVKGTCQMLQFMILGMILWYKGINTLAMKLLLKGKEFLLDLNFCSLIRRYFTITGCKIGSFQKIITLKSAYVSHLIVTGITTPSALILVEYSKPTQKHLTS